MVGVLYLERLQLRFVSGMNPSINAYDTEDRQKVITPKLLRAGIHNIPNQGIIIAQKKGGLHLPRIVSGSEFKNSKIREGRERIDQNQVMSRSADSF